MSIQTNASAIGALQMVTCFAIAHTHLLECPVLGSVVCCAACHETAKHDSWTLLESEVVRKEVLWLGDKV